MMNHAVLAAEERLLGLTLTHANHVRKFGGAMQRDIGVEYEQTIRH